VIRWHLKDVLQEECVQLGDLPEDHKLNDGGKSHRRGLGIQPANGRPALGRKLQHGTLDFTRCGGYVLNTGPLVLAHLQNLADLQTHPNAETVADDHIQDEGIPPALDEVGQQVRKGYFGNLPHHRNGPQNAHVTNEDGLKGPAQEVTPGKDVQVAFNAIPTDVRTIDAILLEIMKLLVTYWAVYNDEGLTFSISIWKFFNFGSIQ